MNVNVTMTKNLRIALSALADEGLRVIRVSNGRRHMKLHLADGRVIPMSRGSSVDVNFERIQRQQAKRLARTAERGGADPRVALPPYPDTRELERHRA
jgi:hypothetical protein